MQNTTVSMNSIECGIKEILNYNTSFVYYREFAPGTVHLTGDWVCGDDSKQCRYYKMTSNKKDFCDDWSSIYKYLPHEKSD